MDKLSGVIRSKDFGREQPVTAHGQKQDLDEERNRRMVETLSDLVRGDDAAVQNCLAWLEKLDRRVRELGHALEPALHADDLTATARSVVLSRVEQAARQCALTFGERRYREVVSESVVAWVDPMLNCGANACCRIMIAVQDESLSVEELNRWLNQLLAPRGEVSRLQELLIWATYQRSPHQGAGADSRAGTVPFERLQLDPATQSVTIDGRVFQIKHPGAFAAYRLIVEAGGRLVTPAELKKLPACKGRIDRLFRDHLAEEVRQTFRSKKGHGGGYWRQLPISP